jgi:hypothetical protein
MDHFQQQQQKQTPKIWIYTVLDGANRVILTFFVTFFISFAIKKNVKALMQCMYSFA